ncbi:MAG TPA: zinc ribbon domain-containing protein [Abditibacteriaceae bacterium]|nr:zinc ribbon domain-containing protein [Abditibacteriaceae bacterium]
MIKCPNADCGYENVDGTQFCEGCGEELPQAGASATSANAASGNAGGNTPIHGAATTPAAASGQVRCPACENMNPADNVVCEVCGTELHPGAAPSTTSPTTAPLPSVSTQSSTGSGVTPVAVPSTAGPTTSTDPLATGTATPLVAAVAASTTSSTDPSATTFSADAPAAMATTIAPSVGGSSTTDTMMPVVAAGDTTSGVSPTGTTMPTADDAFAAPSATSSPVAGGIASADPVSASPTVADPNAAPVATPSANMEPGRVKMTVEQGMTIGKQFVLGDAELLVGREDEDEQIFPDIDLSDQDEGFVHRKHAQLKFENGGLTVTHLGGANKTRVNNKPLADNVAQAVNIGDKVSFGKVVMRVGSI